MSIIINIIAILVVAIIIAIVIMYLWEQYLSGNLAVKKGLFKQAEEQKSYVRKLRGDKPDWDIDIDGEQWKGHNLEERKFNTPNPIYIAEYYGPTKGIETKAFSADDYEFGKTRGALAGSIDIIRVLGKNGLTADKRKIIEQKKREGQYLDIIDKYEKKLRIDPKDSAVKAIKQNEKTSSIRFSGSMGGQGRGYSTDEEGEKNEEQTN